MIEGLKQLRTLTMAAPLLGAAMACAQQPFDLDVTFRTEISSINVNSVYPLASGQLLISGQMVFPGMEPFTLTQGALLEPDGLRSMAFPEYTGWGGGLITPWSDRFYALTGQSVQRFFPNGSLDPLFEMNTSTLFITGSGGNDYHIYPDGSVLVIGLHTLNDPNHGFVGDYNLIWLTNTGELDTTKTHRRGNGYIAHMQVQPDGKFLLSGTCTTWEGAPVANQFRVHPDGALDTTFNSPFHWGQVWKFTVLEDGRILASGMFKTNTASTDTLHFVRMMPDGSLDPSFNNNMECTQSSWLPPVWPNDPVYFGQFTIITHQRLSDGRIVLFMPHGTVDGEVRKGIAMLDADGNLQEQPFNPGGCGRYNYQTPSGDFLFGEVDGLLEADDGYIYIWGAYHGYDDGTTNDADQRFVSRLYGLNVGVRAHTTVPLQLQPNPTHGPLSIALPASVQAQHAEVVDTHGRVVWSGTLPSGSDAVRIDLASLNQGAYVLRLRMTDDSVRNGRFVIVK